jgi:hypothetical protein
MRLLLGTDEAGYGPNLGPLIIAATAWEVPERIAPEAMYDALNEVVCNGAVKPDDCRLPIADSKQLYKPGLGLASLERAVLTALAILAREATSWKNIWRQFNDADEAAQWLADPWHDGYDEPLPIDVLPEQLPPLADLFARGCQARGVRLVGLQAAVLMPAEFNRLVQQCGNKAEVLSLTTLELVRRLLAKLPAGDVQVCCDKHGGRDYYAALIQHVFPEGLPRVRHESSELSVYEVRDGGRPIEFRFLVGGERMLPTALASMTAKYVRELAMRPFNAFWQRQIPGLKATAGYSTDAKRFLADIREARERLGIEPCTFWRSR